MAMWIPSLITLIDMLSSVELLFLQRQVYIIAARCDQMQLNPKRQFFQLVCRLDKMAAKALQLHSLWYLSKKTQHKQ